MIVDNGKVIAGASDLAAASACEFSWLRRLDEKLGRIEPRERSVDAMLARTAKLGDVHEKEVLQAYRDAGKTVTIIGRPNRNDPASLDKAIAETLSALESKADIVFQAAFASDDEYGLPSIGYADFIVLQPNGTYRVQDTKLARSARVTALLQLAAYAGQLRHLGIPTDDSVDLILGDGQISTHRLKDIEPMYVLRRRRLALMVDERLEDKSPVDWEDERYSRCGGCEDCTAEIEEHRDMWLVYNLRGAQRAKLREAGLKTIDDVAAWSEGDPDGGVPTRTLTRLARQAGLQIASENLDQPEYEVIRPDVLTQLPEPSPGDIFFDFEGDPLWTPDGKTWGIDYLFGLIDTNENFTAFWAHTMEEEKQALLDFLDFVEDRRRQYPDLHIYHYASYERSHLTSIAQRHGVGEDRVDKLLKEHVLVDLYSTVGGALQIGSPSYSIKMVEALHMAGEHREGVTNAADSVDQYAQYVQLREAGKVEEAQALLQEIADYNEYDCISTLRLRDWLLNLAAPYLTEETPRPANLDVEPNKKGDEFEDLSALEESVKARAGDPFDPERSDEERAWGLAGAALWYHKREEKSFWWEHFARLSEPVEEWADNRGVFHITNVEVTRDWSKLSPKQSTSRELKLFGYWSEGSTPKVGGIHLIYDFPGIGISGTPNERDAIGADLESIDEEFIIVVERLKKEITTPYEQTPLAVAPGRPIETVNLKKAIRSWVEAAESAREIPDDPMGDLFRRRASRLKDGGGLSPVEDEDTVSAVIDSLLRLDSSYLAVQGPPGTGKTYVAANAIVRLVRDHDWKVGVVAQSHKVVDNVVLRASKFGLEPHLIGKAQSKKTDKLPLSIEHFENADAQKFVNSRPSGLLLGGTAWCFSRLAPGSLDLLVIDEAGQYSLANTIAAGISARNLLLVGDPQQLPQVSVGTHPEPVDTSALGFLSAGHDVLPPEFGYFLAQSRRMDEGVTKPVSELSYEGQLFSHPTTQARQLIGVTSGLLPVPVAHHGNVTSSVEEARAVLTLINDHLGAQWDDGEGPHGKGPRSLEQKDIIVVTPYNAQVAVVSDVLEKAGLDEVRVGTVDKFQGQEAVLAITTLAASSAAEVPRGLSFLLMRNRLNVSISRAQWKSFLVFSPALLDHLPNTPAGLAEMSAFAQLVSTNTSS